MDQAQSKRVKGGRPRRHSPDAKRPTMSFRIGSKLHERLITAAAANERSLSEEIERRVEDSFGPNEAMKAALREVLGEHREMRPIPDASAANRGGHKHYVQVKSWGPSLGPRGGSTIA